MPEAELTHSETQGNYQQEREKEKRQEVLTYLIKSGRVGTPEEAERYLASLDHLKEKLVPLARELLTEQTRSGAPDSRSWDDPLVRLGHNYASRSDLENMTVRNIDRTDPTIWKLERTARPSPYSYLPSYAPHRGGYFYKDHLQVGLRGGPSVEIEPDIGGKIVKKFHECLSEEEMEFLRREYAFALKDLERELRRVADEVATQHGSTFPGWRQLFQVEREQDG